MGQKDKKKTQPKTEKVWRPISFFTDDGYLLITQDKKESPLFRVEIADDKELIGVVDISGTPTFTPSRTDMGFDMDVLGDLWGAMTDLYRISK